MGAMGAQLCLAMVGLSHQTGLHHSTSLRPLLPAWVRSSIGGYYFTTTGGTIVGFVGEKRIQMLAR